MQGNIDVVESLLKHGADIHAKNFDGWTAMHFATLYDSKIIACFRGDRLEFSVPCQPSTDTLSSQRRFWRHSSHPLSTHSSVRPRYYVSLWGLVTPHPSNSLIPKSRRIPIQETPEEIRSRQKSQLAGLNIAGLLVRYGANPNVADLRGMTALGMAMSQLRLSKDDRERDPIFDVLWAACVQRNLGSNCELRFSVGYAAKKRNLVHLYGLLSTGRDIEDVYEKRTPLYWASKNKDYEAVQLLLSYSARGDRSGGDNSYIPLHFAARANDLDMVKLLLPTVDNLDVTDELGRTPYNISRCKYPGAHRTHSALLGFLDGLKG